jgi:WD40 repeat protein
VSWVVARGEPQAVLRGHQLTVTCVAFAPDGRTLASASSDGTIQLWGLPAAKALRTLRVHEFPPPGAIILAFEPGGRVLIAQSPGVGITRWDVASGNRVATLGRIEARFPAVAFAPDGRTLARALNSGQIELWDLADGRRRSAWRGHSGAVLTLAFAPDGRSLASGGSDRAVRMWDLAPDGR